MKTSEKVAFIKGLMEGFELDSSKPETKILNKMLEVLEELAASNNALIEENVKLKEYVEELDSDLGDLEEYVYDADYGYEDDEYGDEDDDFFGDFDPDLIDGEDDGDSDGEIDN